MKLGTVIPYLKRSKKYINDTTHPLSSTDISFFFNNNQQLLLSQKIQIKMHLNPEFSILLTFFESLKIVLINMVAIFMIPAKLATLGLLYVIIPLR